MPQALTVGVVTPPEFVPVPSVAFIFYALFGGQASFRQILNTARVNMRLDEADAASDNAKLHAFALTLDGDDVLHEQRPCGLHQNHLSMMSVVKAPGGRPLISRMYSMALLMRTHG